MRTTDLVKIISSFCLLLLAFGIYAAWRSPATGYESSIYGSTPLIFWIASAISIITGVFIVVLKISGNATDRLNSVMIPTMLVFLGFASILALFIIRGYTLWSAEDPFTHIGEIRNIIDTNHINDDLIYPITHVYVAQFSEVSNISIFTLSRLIPFILGLLSVLFTYCLTKIVLVEKGQIILATLLSMTFVTAWFLNLTPNGLANLMFPLAVFLIVKALSNNEMRWNILLVITIMLYPLFHPIPTLAILLIFLSMFVANYLFNRHETIIFPRYDLVARFSKRNSIFVLVWAMIWISSHQVWNYEISRIYSLIMEGGQSKIGDLVAQIDYAVGHNYNVAEIFFKTYGGLAILGILTVIACLILLKNVKLYCNYQPLFLLIVPLASIVLAIITFYLVNFAFSPTRLLVYIEIIAMLFSGFVLFEMVRKKNLGSVLLVTVIVLYLFVGGVLQLYPSRYVLLPNWQVTSSEITGMAWYIDKKDENKLQTYMSLSVYRYADLLLDAEEKNQRKDIVRRLPDDLRLPWHFGYDKGENLGQNYSMDIYVVLNKQDRLVYKEIYPEMGSIRLLTSDFNQLEMDVSVDKLYSNGGFDSYYIRGLSSLK